MGEFVTDTGLRRKTLQEIRTDLENGFKKVFGPEFETSVDSPNGLFIGQLSLAFSKLWELAFEVFSSRDPGQATGLALDYAAALNGITRKTALPCTVRAMLYTLEQSVTIPAGSQALRPRGNLLFDLDEAVTINRSLCDQLMILDDGSQKNTEYVFHFTFGDVTLNNTSLTADNISQLATAITAAGGTCEFITGGLLVKDANNTQVGITGELPDDWNIYAGALGNFTAVVTGLQTCEIGELDEIPREVSGWELVYNYEAGVPGTNIESDEQLRVRRAASARSILASGTDSAIAAHLLEEVTGVTAASVVSNRTMTEDAAGRPPKSFETLVVGGSNQTVAQNIWQNQPAGIQSYGNTSVEISDGEGIGQIVSFSRPQAKYLWVKITWERYTEESAPTNDEIKAALLNFASREYQMGVDVISQRLLQGLYSGTTGIGNATAQIAVTDSPEGTPTYGSTIDKISIGPLDYAALDADRITLVEET
jgi:uncharacterized phage protein gp47/JayE